jgi:hypothetical protein
VKCVIKLLRFECVARNSRSSPSSDRVPQKHGWKNVAAARIASTQVFVSRELFILYFYLSYWYDDQILGIVASELITT